MISQSIFLLWNCSMAIFNFLFANADGSIDKTAVWTAFLALVTFVLALVAVIQLSSIKKIARADYLKRLNDSFFTEEMRNLLVLLLNSAIEFSILPIKDEQGKNNIDELPNFKIKQYVLDQLWKSGMISIPDWRKSYNAFEIDDWLLGPLDDVGRFEKNGLLDMRSAYDTFGYYVIELVGKNQPVRDFLNHEDSKGNYDDLEYLYKKFLSYQKRSGLIQGNKVDNGEEEEKKNNNNPARLPK